MAKWYTSVVTGSALIFAGLVGCEQNSPSAALPEPNFNPPQMVAVAPPPALPPMPSESVPLAPPPSKSPTAPRAPLASNAPRDWVPPVAPRAWRWIIIHHSATTTGGAVAFDKMHRAKGWDELGYDFVIGNGTDTADGQVEVGPRWVKQKYGAHAKTPDNRYNEYGIGICLVGNFDLERPTPAQMKSVDKLVSYLMKTYRITPDRVLGHGDTKATDCPGRYMDVAAVRRQSALLAGMGSVALTDEPSSSTELMTDFSQH